MKNLKKFLSVILAIVMIILSAPLDGFENFNWRGFALEASAVDISGTISSGETESFSMKTKGTTFVAFTPEVSGEYRCEIESATVSSDLRLYDEDMNILDRGAGGSGSYQYRVTHKMYSGETYYFVVVQTEPVYGNCSFTLSLEMENEIEDLISIQDGETLTLSMDNGDVRVVFTPEETGTYTFFSNEKNSSYCKLYTPGMVLLEYDKGNDDCAFSVKYNFEAGKKYYFDVSGSDEITVTLQQLVCKHDNVRNSASVASSCDKTGFTEGQYCRDCGRWLSGYDLIVKQHVDTNEDGICDICEETASECIDSGKCGEEAYWSFYDNGELVISGNGTMYGYGKEYEYASVESTPPYFAYASKITKITVEEGIRTIGRSAFEDFDNLTEVVLPEGLIIINERAFSCCRNLQQINLPDGLKYIGYMCFEYCIALASLNIPGSVETYTSHMLHNCSALTEITINEGTKEIGAYAFIWCESLETINIPKSVNSIDEAVFVACNSLKNINISNENEYYFTDEYGVLYDIEQTTLLKYPCARENEEYVVPDKVKKIGDRAFAESVNLKQVTLPDHIDRIGFQMFEDCTSLESFVMPADATELQSNAFSGCSALSTVKLNNKLEEIGTGNFNDSEKLKNVIVPDSVKEIESYAFNLNVGSLTILNPECNIDSNAIDVDDSDSVPVIYGYAGSTAKNYAAERGFAFISVNDFEISKVSVSSMPVKVNYGLNESFDSDGFVLQIDYANGKSYCFSKRVSFSGFDSSKAGKCTVTASVGDAKAEFDVEILKDPQEQIFVDSNPNVNVVAGQNTYLKFIPECNGTFSFSTWGGEYCLLSIYDEDMNLIKTLEESEMYPRLTITLEQGETYYWASNFDTYSGPVSFSLYCDEISCEHNDTLTIKAQLPTCTSGGYTEGVRCSDCDAWISGHKSIRAIHTDENDDNVCDVCSMQFSYAVKENETVKISGEYESFKYLKFVPEKTGLYTLTALNDEAIELYDENMSRLYVDGQSENDDGYRTSLTTLLKEDTVYYVLLDSFDKRLGFTEYFKAEITAECVAKEFVLGELFYSDEDSRYALYEFTPEETETYKLTTACSKRTYEVVFYDEDLNEFLPDDWDYSENGIILSSELQKNEKYYFFTKQNHYDDTTAVISAVLTKLCSHENLIDVPGTLPTCTEGGWSDGVQCAECLEWISGHTVIPVAHTDDDFDGICDICGALASDITVDAAKKVTTGTDDFLKFVPTVSGTYTFTSDSDECDPYVRLLNADKEQIGYDDDGGSGLDFSVTYSFKKGQTYYFDISCYDGDGCTFDVLLTLDAIDCQHETTVIVEAVKGNCTVDGYSEGEQCSVCGEWVSGHELVEMACHKDEDGDTVCDVCGELANDIVFGKVKYITYNGDEKTFIRFIPEQTGRYEFAVKDWKDTNSPKYYELTDNEGKELFDGSVSGDDGGYNIESAELTEGQVYYFSIKDANDETGVASIELRNFCSHTNKENRDKIEPTCEDSGREAGVYCNDCYNWISGGEWLNSSGHSYGEWSVDTNFSCMTDGSMSRVCGKCARGETQILHAMHTDENNDLFCDKCSCNIDVLYEGTEGSVWWKLYNEGSLVVGGTGSTGSIEYDEDEDSGNGDYAFYQYRDYVKSLRIMDGITVFGFDFNNCHQLKKVTMADSVKEIWYSVFENCSSLETVIFGEGLESVNGGVFAGCKSLKNIVIPASFKEWGYGGMFNDCINLEVITILSTSGGYSYELDAGFAFAKEINYAGSENSQLVKDIMSKYPDIKINCNYVPGHTHSFNVVTMRAGSCSNDGVATYSCSCGVSYLESVYSSHKDENVDRKCDLCGESTLVKSGDCSGENSRATWSLYDNGDMVISGQGTMKLKDEDYNYEYDVQDHYDSRIRNLIIEEGITALDDEVFENFITVETVSFPDTLVSIGRLAFRNCTGITSLVIPDSVTSVSSYAFEGCTGLINLTLSDNLKVLESSVFGNCSNLKSVTLPSALEEITVNSENAFEKCEYLESFAISQENKNYTVVDGVLYDKAVKTVISYPPAKQSVQLPESVDTLGVFCFKDTSFETIELPEVSKISWGAFYDSDVKNVEIPSSVNKIERWAFCGCDELEAIRVPGNVKTIDAHAFDGCSSAKTIELEYGIKSIFGCVFLGCSSVERIAIPDSVVALSSDGDSYGAFLFNGCTNLEEVLLPVGIREIGVGWFDGMFGNCPNLKRVIVSGETVITRVATELPDTVTETHGDLKYLDNIVVSDTDTSSDAAFYVKDGTVSIASDISKAVIDTKGTAKKIEIPDSVKFIKGDALGDAWLQQQNDGMIYIGNVAYKYKGTMAADTQLVIAEGTTAISDAAFVDYESAGQSNLISVVMPEGVSIIGSNAFSNCTNLSSVLLPCTLEYIEECAFCNTAIESIVIPASVERIYDGAFYGCKNLESVTVSDGVKMIGDYGLASYSKQGAFGNCTKLKSISLPESVELIWSYSFNGCTALDKIEIYNSSCEIFDSPYTIPRNAVIYGYEGSTAQAYANTYNREFVALDEEGHSHSYSETITVQPTCAVDGVKTRVCTICGESSTEAIPATGKHIKNEGVYTVEPNCAQEGEIVYYCIECKCEISKEIVSPTGNHSWSEWTVIKQATPEQNGEQKRECTVCTKEETKEIQFVSVDVTHIILSSADITLAVGDTVTVTATVLPEDATNKSITWSVEDDSIVTVNEGVVTAKREGETRIIVTAADGEKTAVCTVKVIADNTRPEHLAGDINGDNAVNNKDLNRLMKYLAGYEVEVNEAALDVNGDNEVNNKDLNRLMKYLAGYEVEIF